MKNASVENITVRSILLAPIKCTYERGTLIRTLIRLDWQMRNWFSMGQNNFRKKKNTIMTKDKFKKGKITKKVLYHCGRRLWKCNLFSVFHFETALLFGLQKKFTYKGGERNPCHKVFFLSFGTALGCSLEEDDGGMHDEASTNKKVAMFTHTLTFAWR